MVNILIKICKDMESFSRPPLEGTTPFMSCDDDFV